MRVLILLCLCVGAFANHFVTFIIPCYNCEEWIEGAVQSIYQQNLNDPFEIICTDDASTDSTYDILSTLSEDFPELYVLRHATNRGGGATRNTCVQESEGDLIFCLDADNILAPHSVQRLIDHLDATKSDIVSFGKVCYFTDDLKETGLITYHCLDNQYRLQDILQTTDSPPFSGNYLYTRESFDRAGGYPTQYGALDTFAFGFEQLAHHCKLTFVPETFYWHRSGIESYFVRESRNNQLSIDFFQFLLQHRNLFKKKTTHWLEKELSRAFKGKEFRDAMWALSNHKLILK